LVFAINPAIFEKMAFRGILFSNLERKFSQKQVIWMTSILFGLFHFTGMANGQSLITVIILGILAGSYALSWGYMILKTRSVVPSVIMHYLINALSDVFVNPNTNNDNLIILHFLGILILYPIISIWAIKQVTSKNIKDISNETSITP